MYIKEKTSEVDSDGPYDVITYVRHPGRGLQERLDNVSCGSSSACLFIYFLKENP